MQVEVNYVHQAGTGGYIECGWEHTERDIGYPLVGASFVFVNASEWHAVGERNVPMSTIWRDIDAVWSLVFGREAPDRNAFKHFGATGSEADQGDFIVRFGANVNIVGAAGLRLSRHFQRAEEYSEHNNGINQNARPTGRR